MFSRLKVQQKLALLCATFLLPIIFLVFLFVDKTETDVGIAASELKGVTYFEALPTEFTPRIDLSQKSASAGAMAAAQSAVLNMDANEAAEMDAAEPAE